MFQIDTTQLAQGIRQNAHGEKYLYAVNRSTFENIDSEVIYQQTYKFQFKEENTLYIVVGTDSGLLIEYLYKNPPPKGSTYLFIEFPEVIEKILLEFSPPKKSRTYLTDHEHWVSVAEQYDLADYLFINRVIVVQSYAVKDNYINQYKQLWKQIEQEVSDKKWQYLGKVGSKIFIQTQIDNMNENQFSVSILENIFEGKTAVMLAGGPSLDMYIDWIEKNREKFIVFAVSRIAKRLLSTSIVPDFFVSIDPNEVSFDVSKEMLQYSGKSTLINQYHIIPKLLNQWQGLNFYVGPRYPWFSKNQPPFIDAPGPTVTNVALHAAIFMGIKKIILVGVDLCFSPEGYSHASSSIEHTIGPMSSYVGQLVTTNSGQQAETENSFFNAISTLRAQAEQALNNNCEFINPSPNSAKIEGVKYIPIDELHLSGEAGNVKEIIKKCLPKDLITAKKEHYETILKAIKEQQKELKKIISLTEKGLKYNENLFKDNQPEKNFKFKIKMDKLEKRLDKQFFALSPVCRSFGIQSFLKFFKPAYDKDMNNSEVKEWGDLYYEAYKTGSVELNKSLKQATLRTEKRIKELSLEEHIDELLEFWKKDNSLGRAVILKNNSPEIYDNLNTAQKHTIDSYIHEFEEIITGSFEKSEQFNRIKQLADLSGGEAKAYDYYVREDKAGLERMITSLEKHSDPRAIPMKHLAQGYLHELNDDINEAILVYQNADKGIALEAALKQLALISIAKKDLELAEKALDLLCGISLAYIPQLANIYKIQGRIKDALDAYALYLDNFPEDIVTMLKLASLYEDIENNDAALYVYEHILTIDPKNITARHQIDIIKKH